MVLSILLASKNSKNVISNFCFFKSEIFYRSEFFSQDCVALRLVESASQAENNKTSRLTIYVPNFETKHFNLQNSYNRT